MSYPSEEQHYIRMAEQLDNLDFPDVINIISLVKDGKYVILPHIRKIKSTLDTINPHNLCRCCRTEKLVLPNCTNLTDTVLVNLPYITSMTISAQSNLTGDIFRHLNYLKELQILSSSSDSPDTMIDSDSVKNLGNLEKLHVYNNLLTTDDFRFMKKLRVIVIDSNNPHLTGAILNYLKFSEICVINRVLYKYKSSDRNSAILKKIGGVDRIQIKGI